MPAPTRKVGPTAFDLAGAAGKQVETHSGGMRRRLDLAASFLVPAELPSSGSTRSATSRRG
jgi:hypothetical protein